MVIFAHAHTETITAHPIMKAALRSFYIVIDNKDKILHSDTFFRDQHAGILITLAADCHKLKMPKSLNMLLMMLLENIKLKALSDILAFWPSFTCHSPKIYAS